MNPLSVVLLGPPSSGKSALLGALEQAGKTPESLGGQLVDLVGQLKAMSTLSREGKLTPTQEEIAVYPLELVNADRGAPEAIELHDTSGIKAQAILAGAEPLNSADLLPRTLAKADGAIVLVDVTKPLDPQVKQVTSFLKSLEDRRSDQTEIVGLPMFVVLTKCDQLPASKDRPWMLQVEDAKRKVGDYFKKKLGESDDRAFGRVDLRVWATSTRRPDGDDRRATQPYQVAELFRQAFDAARDFRRRGERSKSLLETSLMGLGAVAFFLAAAVIWRFATEPTPAVAALLSHVQAVTVSASAPAERYREPIADRLKELEEIAADPLFSSLPSAMQKEVHEIRRDVETYRRLDEDFRAKFKSPRVITESAKLVEYEKSLGAIDLTKWPDTRLSKRRSEWLKEAETLRKAVDDEVAWTNRQTAKGRELQKELVEGKVDAARRGSWFAQVNDYLRQGRRHEGNTRIADSTIPYRVVYQFDAVHTAEQGDPSADDAQRKIGWLEQKDKLKQLSDLAK